jgi:hypothetical protein
MVRRQPSLRHALEVIQSRLCLDHNFQHEDKSALRQGNPDALQANKDLAVHFGARTRFVMTGGHLEI